MKVSVRREPLHFHFVRIAKQFAAKPAIIDRGASQTYTYGRVLTASLLLAEKLARLDAASIGVMLPTSAAAAIVILAVLMSGRTPVFLNFSTGVQSSVDYGRRKCRCATVITARGFLERLGAPMLDGLLCIEDLLGDVSLFEKGKAKLRARGSSERILSGLPACDIDRVAGVLFTAGSEQEPKAVPLTHRNIIANLEAITQVSPFSGDDIMLATLPFFHVFGLTTGLWLPLRFGMTIVSHGNPLDFKTLCMIVAEERPTYLVGTPSFLRGYLHHSRSGDFASLKLIVTGADKCPDSVRQGFQEKHGLQIYEGYGTTEMSPIITVNTPEYHRSGSVGRALPNIQIRMERHDTGEECRSGEPGRILVRGESVFSGYLGDAEATARSFRNGWYDTGDMGYLDRDGFLWHVGRFRRFVKIGGEMVSLIQIEEVLEKFLPPATSCCVVAVADEMKGARIVAAVTRPIDERRVMQDMAKHLPTVAVPRLFVLMEELPKMASGKTDFRLISERVQQTIKVSMEGDRP